MDATPLLFIVFIMVAGILLGMACKAMTATEEEQADAAKAADPPSQPAVSPAEMPSASPGDTNTKDCKSCGGHSQAGRFCSFCGRAL